MGLVRNENDYLTLNECLFTYVDADAVPAEDLMPKPLYVDYLYDNLYYENIKDTYLIQKILAFH